MSTTATPALLARIEVLKEAIAFYQAKMYDTRETAAAAAEYAAKRDEAGKELLAIRESFATI